MVDEAARAHPRSPCGQQSGIYGRLASDRIGARIACACSSVGLERRSPEPKVARSNRARRTTNPHPETLHIDKLNRPFEASSEHVHRPRRTARLYLIAAGSQSYATGPVSTGKGLIVRFALETKADLVVMAVRGRGALDLAVFGSTTQRVMQFAPCPAFVVHV